MKAVAVVPGLGLLASYQARWLRRDLVAGLVLTALLVPQGMAYAELAGLPPITGLYTSILCLVGYALFGPSRILVLGPDSSLGPMIAATLLPLVAADGDPARAVALGSALALMVGAITLVAGIAKLGFIADLISKPTMIGYMNGLAVTILVGQLPKLFGFSVDADGFIGEVAGFVQGVGATARPSRPPWPSGSSAWSSSWRCSGSLPKVPAVLVAVVLSIGAAGVLRSRASTASSLVGALPQGFPPFTVPRIALSDLPVLLAGRVGHRGRLAGRHHLHRVRVRGTHGADVDGNREMIGIGAANVAAGLFQGFPVSTSGSRTAVAEQAGAKTQVTGLVGAAAITLILLLAPGLLRNLPQPTLAAVVIAASLSLADITGPCGSTGCGEPSSCCPSPPSSASCCSACSPASRSRSALSIGNVFRRAWWPYQTVLGPGARAPGLPRRAAATRARAAAGCVDLPVRRAAVLRQRTDVPRTDPRARGAEPRPQWIIVAAEPITDVDTTAADMLRDLDEDLNADGVNLVFAEMKDPVRDKIDRYELTPTIDPAHFFPTLEAAVAACQRETGAQWGPATAEEAP